MSNSSFTGVSNEDSFNRIAASSSDISNIRAGIINCDSVQISLPKAAATVKITSWTSSFYAMSAANMSLMAKGYVLLDDNGTTGNGNLTISTADTAAEALRLLALFNITDTNPTRLITFSHINAITAGIIAIAAKSGVNTRNYVTYMTNSGAPNPFATIGVSGFSRNAYVLVYRGLDVVNDKTIVFEVIGYAVS